MPTNIKLILCLFVIIASVGVYHFQSEAGQTYTPWVSLGLGAFMIFALWVFPEERKRSK